jgi:magnesium transporter
MKIASLLAADVAEIARVDPAALREGLDGLHGADVAEVLAEIDREDRVTVMEHLTAATLGQSLTYADGETLKVALTRLAPNSLAPALDTLEADDAASLLGFLPEEKRAPLLAFMSPGHAAAARRLLLYEPGTAGRLMTDKFVRLSAKWTVGETLEHLRQVDPEVATVADLYVVAEDGRLSGVISLRRILPKQAGIRIGSIMTSEVISVPPEAAQDEVARLVSKYGFNALPVVNAEGRILGIITVDDVVDVLVQSETQAALRMGAVAADEPWSRGVLDYFGTSIVRVVRRRLGWLLLLFVAETFTGSVLRHFEDELGKVVALSFFIPLIIGTGGNAGSQTVSTIIRALALKQVRVADALRVLVRETSAGFLLGGLLCLVAAARSMLWGTGPQLALVVGLTILAVCAWANIVGALVPLAAEKFRIDPTVVSAPFITTVVDGTGLAIYMMIAKVVMHL